MAQVETAVVLCEHRCWSCTYVSNAISLFTCIKGSLRLLAPKDCASVRFFCILRRVLWHFSRTFVQFSWIFSTWVLLPARGRWGGYIPGIGPRKRSCVRSFYLHFSFTPPFTPPFTSPTFHLPWIYCTRGEGELWNRFYELRPVVLHVDNFGAEL